eukprot:51293-Amphidinium_carterae.2
MLAAKIGCSGDACIDKELWAKVREKLRNGWLVGPFDALTDHEQFVGRLAKLYQDGSLLTLPRTLGGIGRLYANTSQGVAIFQSALSLHKPLLFHPK